MALAIAGFHVGHAVELVGQRAQALGEQADRAGVHGEFARLGLEQIAGGADDVADIPGLERGVEFFADGIAGHVQLDAAGHVLDREEACLAHDTFEHDAACHDDGDRIGFEVFSRFFVESGVQFAGKVFATKIVRIGFASGTPFGELGAAFRNQLVGVCNLGFF